MEKILVKIAANATVGKVFEPSRELKRVISDILSYEVENAGFTNAFQNGSWSGVSTFFDFKNCTFPAGFVDYLKRSLERRGYQVHAVKKQAPAPLGPQFPVVDSFPDDPKYWYQMETVRRLESKWRMIAQLATGAGKSRVARLCYARIARKTMFLTTRSVLLYQMRNDFIANMNERCGIIGDGEFLPHSGFNVCMVQTLASMLKNPSARSSAIKVAEQRRRIQMAVDFLKDVEFVILEEAHEVGSDSFYKIIQYCFNAHYRLALTATPFMKANSESNMRLMACVGSIGIKVSEKDLIDSGVLAKPYFKLISAEKPVDLKKTTSWPTCYDVGIVNNQFRNYMICHQAITAIGHNLSVLILVLRQNHGKILRNALVTAGISCEFIYGEHENDERKRALRKLESGQIKVLIGSTILDVGADMPCIGMIILAGGGKEEVALRQRIGRGLRRKKTGNNVVFVADFQDVGNKHLRSHALARRNVIENTPGFAENILPEGADFNY